MRNNAIAMTLVWGVVSTLGTIVVGPAGTVRADVAAVAPRPDVAGSKIVDRHVRAVAEIRRLGGQVTTNRDADGNIASVSVRLENGWTGGEGELRHLKDLVNLKSLFLNIPTSDEGLKHLEPLTDLESLWLRNAPGVTDAGLVRLKSLRDLRRLAIFNAPISLAGMEHLTGLKKLYYVVLRDTKIHYGKERPELKRLFPQVTDW